MILRVSERESPIVFSPTSHPKKRAVGSKEIELKSSKDINGIDVHTLLINFPYTVNIMQPETKEKTMILSRHSIEILLDLIEIKVSALEIEDYEDEREMTKLKRCRQELKTALQNLSSHNAHPSQLPFLASAKA